MNELKVFTIEEANDLLPILTELLSELQSKRDLAAEVEVQIDALEIAGTSGQSSLQEMSRLMEEHRQAVNEFYNIVDQIHELGCFLKDPDLGLIDFYGLVDGQVVYFCWKMGEDQIHFWHEVGQGYANRKTLDY